MRATASETTTTPTGSRLISGWLRDQNASLAFSTYQAGKLLNAA